MNICTLIPAYKSKYIENLLTALRAQTVPPSRIIFSDDSPNGMYRQRLMSEQVQPLLAGLNVEIVEGPRCGAFENFKNLVRVWNGETDLFHILLDDDVIYPEFYERHLVAHTSGNFSCSISKRWEAGEDGQPLRGQAAPGAVAVAAQRMLALNADVLFMTTVAECKNWLGEFSNTVFRKEHSPIVLDPTLAAVSYAGLWDLGAFLAASMQQPLCYIQEYLGFFRRSPEQNSAQTFAPIMKAGVLGYVALGISGGRLGKMSKEQALHCFAIISGALNYWYATQDDLAELRLAVAQLAADADGAETGFLSAWNTFLNNHGY